MRLVAQEIAIHHVKDEPVEFAAQDFAAVARQMTVLPFELRAPRRLEPECRPIGARYCSVLGQTAAQVRLRDPSGHLLTLYETAAGERLRTLPEGDVNVAGVRVRVWQEDGILFCLAETVGSAS